MALEFIDSTSAYQYSASGDFNIPADDISLTCLHAEAHQVFLSQFVAVFREGDIILFLFTEPLSDTSLLDGVVSDHTGECPEKTEDNQQAVSTTAPQPGEVLVWDATAEVWTNAHLEHSNLTDLSSDDHTQYVPTDASRGMEADWEAGNIRITADGGFSVEEAELDAARYLSITGKLSGGLVSQNAIDDQLLDVTAGTAIVTNFTDINNPQVKEISWDAFTFDPGFEDTLIKWVGMEYNWTTGDATAIVDVEFTTKERRSIVVLARVWGTTPGSTEITTVANYATPAYMPGKSIEDLTVALGSINYSGNVYSASDVSMKLGRTAGKAFRFAANYTNDPLDPNTVSYTHLTLPTN